MLRPVVSDNGDKTEYSDEQLIPITRTYLTGVLVTLVMSLSHQLMLTAPCKEPISSCVETTSSVDRWGHLKALERERHLHYCRLRVLSASDAARRPERLFLARTLGLEDWKEKTFCLGSK